MNEERQTITVAQAAPRTSSDAAMVKARLLEWAAATDARRQATGSTISTIAVRGGFVVVGGMIIARMVMPRRRSASRSPLRGLGEYLIGAALVARAAMLIAPYAIRALQGTMKPRDPH